MQTIDYLVGRLTEYQAHLTEGVTDQRAVDMRAAIANRRKLAMLGPGDPSRAIIQAWIDNEAVDLF
jgi:hypothetical protein